MVSRDHALAQIEAYALIGEHERHPWKEMPWPGIFNKVLYCDPVSGFTIELAKIAKGATFPVHYHTTMQTLFLLGGRLRAADRVITPGTFDIIPAGFKHGGYLGEEESIQFKVFSSIPVYILENGDLFFYRYDGSVESGGNTSKSFMATNILSE